ncbi:hypothetical protein AVEN_230102-1 [Araneus ventricosus]|uniref:Uncharacterized protein n=1 Tax=Araneus ventricosus TaxID=182803 RepID=A0A4Y2UWN4_ARAVE|nr:hypothetical protein AVEN_230102-1 [Araneus ventricosus]
MNGEIFKLTAMDKVNLSDDFWKRYLEACRTNDDIMCKFLIVCDVNIFMDFETLQEKLELHILTLIRHTVVTSYGLQKHSTEKLNCTYTYTDRTTGKFRPMDGNVPKLTATKNQIDLSDDFWKADI